MHAISRNFCDICFIFSQAVLATLSSAIIGKSFKLVAMSLCQQAVGYNLVPV